MSVVCYEKVSEKEIREWLFDNIPELTKYQKEKIEYEVVRNIPFRLSKKKRTHGNFLIRLSIVFVPIVYVVSLLCLPFVFIVKGRWGYDFGPDSWVIKWFHLCGII